MRVAKTAVLFVGTAFTAFAVSFDLISAEPPTTAGPQRVYHNELKPIENPRPLLADYPEFVEPVLEERHYEAPVLVNEPGADLDVRAWRFSYNARGIIEMPNRLRADHTAVIVVHPWGIDDGQGWRTPEAGRRGRFLHAAKEPPRRPSHP